MVIDRRAEAAAVDATASESRHGTIKATCLPRIDVACPESTPEPISSTTPS
jgi:hypothetical protein